MVLATAAGWATRYRLFDGGWLKSISQNLMLLENSLGVVAIRWGIEEGVFSFFVSKKQHMVLNLPKSRARIFMLVVTWVWA